MSNEILQGNVKIAEFMEVGIIPATSETLARNQISQEFKTFAECQIYCDEINNRRKFREERDGRTYIPIHPWGEMEYHSSWDWLMPVCKKIVDMKPIEITYMGIPNSITPHITAMRTMKKGAIEIDLEKTYEGVLEFIDWYTLNVTPS